MERSHRMNTLPVLMLLSTFTMLSSACDTSPTHIRYLPIDSTENSQGELPTITSCDFAAYGSTAIVRVLSREVDVQDSSCSGEYSFTANIYTVETVVSFDEETPHPESFKVVSFDQTLGELQKNQLWLVGGRYSREEFFGFPIIPIEEITSEEFNASNDINHGYNRVKLPSSIEDLKDEFSNVRENPEELCPDLYWSSNSEFETYAFSAPSSSCQR